MRNKTSHFLIFSLLAISSVCIIVFASLAVYLNAQSEETVGELGNIYMASMNDRISKHFSTMTEHRLTQMETLTTTIPTAYQNDPEALRDWLVYNGQARGFNSVAFYYSDGTFEMLYGGKVTPASPDTFLDFMKNGERRISVGTNNKREQVVLVGTPVADIDMIGGEGLHCPGGRAAHKLCQRNLVPGRGGLPDLLLCDP